MKEKKMSESKPLDLDVLKAVLEEIYRKKLEAGISQKAYDRYYEIIKITINEIKQRIKEACMFYLRYKDNPKLLFKEKKLKQLFIKEEKLQPFMAQMIKYRYLKQYNEWLFKLAFMSVFEEVKNE